MDKQDRINAFVRTLHEWYVRQKRTLPWRDLKDKNDTERAYKVLVSEVMLQQTQVPRVMITFKKFIQQFPHLKDLAEASNAEILIAWRGMGYNSRALRLRDAAQSIVRDHHGIFPREMKELLAIKGIGHYTAAAVRNFAFHLPTACIDTNVRRVLHRTFYGPENTDGTWATSDGILLSLCEEILNAWVDAGFSCNDFFSALMDFGSLVQTKTNPKWTICPLTAEGIMKTTAKSLKTPVTKKESKEPGRIIAGRFVPNRIIRGRIVEALRDAPNGLPLQKIGPQVAIDWNEKEHREWLQAIVDKLMKEKMILLKQKKLSLA